MEIYLAGSCGKDNRQLLERIAKFLREKYSVYCPFELKIDNAWDITQEEWAKKVFEADKRAIDNCDIMISISQGRYSTAGTNWEQGYAYALNKLIYVFQITNADTSLMTYCGSTYFCNTNEKDILVDMESVLDGRYKQNYCSTTLT